MFDYFSYIDYMQDQWNHGYPEPEPKQEEPEQEQEPEAPQQPANPYDEY